MAVFWKKGFDGTTMRDLTKAKNINSSSLYNTTGDKHQLFVKCISNYTKKGMVAVEYILKLNCPSKKLLIL
jgi:TetR/AcrR family transcriptional repressor of nem operon